MHCLVVYLLLISCVAEQEKEFYCLSASSLTVLSLRAKTTRRTHEYGR